MQGFYRSPRYRRYKHLVRSSNLTIIQGAPSILPVGLGGAESDIGLVLQNNTSAFDGAYKGSEIEELMMSDFDQSDLSNLMIWDGVDYRSDSANAEVDTFLPNEIIVPDTNSDTEISMEEFMTKYQGKFQNNNNEVFSQQNWLWGMREHNNTDGVKENDDS